MTPRSRVAVAESNRRAFSLTELLIAMTIALMVMGSVAQLFSLFGRGLSGSQATVELTARMRATAWQLRKDLTGITCDVVPWLAPEAGAGYFEYVEGTRNDQSAAGGTTNLEADTDDVLLFTSRSLGDPFVGASVTSGTAEAKDAEIAWFCRAMPTQPVSGVTMHNLYRRQLLVSAVPATGVFAGGALTSGSGTPFSSRVGIDGRRYPNALGNLTRRPSRFVTRGVFPSAFPGASAVGATLDGDETGDDVVLTNVIAFDVRAFEPQRGGATGPGAFIDLASGGAGNLGANPAVSSGVTTPTYETSDALNWLQKVSTPTINQWGLNGFNYTFTAPYDVPLRGIEIRLRCYEPTSKQVRQVTIRHSFVK